MKERSLGINYSKATVRRLEIPMPKGFGRHLTTNLVRHWPTEKPNCLETSLVRRRHSGWPRRSERPNCLLSYLEKR